MPLSSQIACAPIQHSTTTPYRSATDGVLAQVFITSELASRESASHPKAIVLQLRLQQALHLSSTSFARLSNGTRLSLRVRRPLNTIPLAMHTDLSHTLRASQSHPIDGLLGGDDSEARRRHYQF
jgi:hypothetical protein